MAGLEMEEEKEVVKTLEKVGLREELVEACARVGWKNPSKIQAAALPYVLQVFKFVKPPENNEKPMDQRSRVKFKIMSLKVKGPMDYVPELFDEQKDDVSKEQILRVIFLDQERPNPAMEKLKRQLAEADVAVEARKKPPEETGPKMIGEGLVIDEWKERRERYLAQQQGEAVDSV